MTRRVLIVLVLFAALAAGAWLRYGAGANQEVNAQDTDGRPPPRAVAVEAAEVTVAEVRTEITAVGSLQANESVLIVPEISGRIAEILFGEGESVVRGDVLVRLEDDILAAELVRARADLTLSQANFERADTLAGQGTGTRRARDEALAALRSAEARVALAEAELANATITAPFEGRLGLRSVSVGDFVTAGQRIVNLEQTDPLKVDFRVPELYLTAVAIDQPVTVTIDALPGETVQGRVQVIAPQIDVNGRALRVRAAIPNPDGRLLPGLFARIGIVVDRREGSLLVPEATIVPQGGSRYVFQVIDGKAVRREVSIGERQNGMVEIVGGLAEGAVVVTAGQMKLRDGAPVDVVAAGAGA